MRRFFLSVVLLFFISCDAKISGRLPTFDGTGFGDEQFDIAFSGTIPRRISIVAEESVRSNGKTLSLDVVRDAALEFITENSEFLRSEGLTLRAESVSANGIQHHAYFSQRLNDLPVFDAGIDVFFTDEFQLELVHNQLTPGLIVLGLGGEITQEEAAEQALSTLSSNAILSSAPSPQLGYEVFEGIATLSYRVRISSENPDTDQLVILDARSGEILEIRNLLKDINAVGNVFPESNRFFSSAFQEEFEVDASGFLRSDAIDVQVGEGARADSAQADFSFSVDDPRFGEVNTFFHMQGLIKFLRQNGISVIEERFPVRVRAVEEVNAFYDPSRRRIILGNDLGLDLSLDGDVVVHEFGHALLDRIRPGLIGSGPEAGAIHEAFGDILAAYYFENPEITEGFALDIVDNLGLGFYELICPGFPFSTEKPFCRNAENTFVVPDDLIGEVHFDSMPLSGALWRTYEGMQAREGLSVGRDLAIRTLMRAAAFLPSTNARFVDFLSAMLEADRTLNAGKFRTEIINAFSAHGIIRADLLQCRSSIDCGSGDRCVSGSCDAGNPQTQACREDTDCSSIGFSCDNGVCIPENGGAFPVTIFAENLPIDIPDADERGTASSIDVPTDVTIERLQVEVDISHPFSEDLTVSIETPTGQIIVLQDREEFSADGINRVFGIVGLEGQGGQGLWTLRVIDRAAENTGNLEAFGLLFN